MSPVRPTVTVVGRRHEVEGHRLRDFLTRTAQPFHWLEAGTAAADEALERRGAAGAALPAVLEATGAVMAPATVEALADAWGLRAAPSRETYDLAVVGAGPAGLAAAVYAASDGLATVVLERDVPGGQASHTSLIENFFGFPEGIGGAELARLAGRQAERFGAELVLLRGATGSGVEPDGTFRLTLDGDHEIRARTVIVAAGMVWRRLGVEGVDALLGRGVHYGAGRSEAAHCCGDPVVVVGAGNSAGQAAMHLAGNDARVTMLVRGTDLGHSMSDYLVRRIADHPLIDVRYRSEVEGARAADGRLAAVDVRSADGAVEEVSARALFLCLGGQPRTGWAAGTGVALDAAGYVLTGPDLLRDGRRPPGWGPARDPFPLETGVPGLFAAGDVRHGSAKRVAGAVGDGAMAVALAHRRLAELDATR